METIKEEKKADLEQLLNSLIEKGWKPRGLETKRFDGEMYYAEIFEHYSNGTMFFDGVEYSLRQLVSKESGLWQFVSKNRLWKDIDEEKYWHKKTPKMSELRSYDYHFEEFRLIESSLKEKSELEDFLLNSIKLD